MARCFERVLQTGSEIVKMERWCEAIFSFSNTIRRVMKEQKLNVDILKCIAIVVV